MRARTGHADEAGLSMVEMLVTVIMFTLIVGSITTVVITSLKHQNSLSVRGSVLATVRTAVERVDRDLRAANPLCSATQTEISMEEIKPTTSGGGVSTIADYKVSGTTIVYSLYGTLVANTNPGNGYPSCAVTTTVNGTPTTTTYYPTTQLINNKLVIKNLVSTTPFSYLPIGSAAGTNYDTCTITGSNPTGVTVSTIPTLMVTFSVRPTSLPKPVTASDCGTYLRNFVVG